MLDGYAIFWSVGKALAFRGTKLLLNAVSGGVLGELWDVAEDAWKELQRKASTEEARQASLQALAQAPMSEVRKQAVEIAQEVAADQPEAVRDNLANYLVHIQATIRRSFRRPSDPSGTTIPPGLGLRRAEDLLALLPDRMPRFREGDRPLPGVPWELVELLGVGGYGEVWKANNPRFPGLAVALKFCLDPKAQDQLLHHEAAMVERMLRERKHDGIVELRQAYLDVNPPCLEYEFVKGGDLGGLIQEWHRSQGGVQPQQAAKVVMRLAEIVGFAHRLNPPIIHRDLKPANILTQNKDGGIVLKVGDFGIGGVAVNQAIAERGESTSALMVAAVARGSYTPLYASPQQRDGKAADPRDDVYSLGVIWYQLLTGDLSQGRPGGSRWLERLTARGMPSVMAKLLESCFEENREDRPGDARTLADQLSTMLSESMSVAVTSPINTTSGGLDSTEKEEPAATVHQATPKAVHAGDTVVVKASPMPVSEPDKEAKPGRFFRRGFLFQCHTSQQSRFKKRSTRPKRNRVLPPKTARSLRLQERGKHKKSSDCKNQEPTQCLALLLRSSHLMVSTSCRVAGRCCFGSYRPAKWLPN